MGQVFAVIISALTMFLFRPETKGGQRAKKQAFEADRMPHVDEGDPQYVIFGDVWIDSWQVLSFGNPRSKPIKTSQGK